MGSSVNIRLHEDWAEPHHGAGYDGPPHGQTGDHRVVCVRMRTAEFEGFSEAISHYELTNSMALRIAARRIAGFLEIDPVVRLQLEAMLGRMGELSGALRTLHQDYMAGGAVDLAALDAQRRAFGEQFAELDALLRTILNVSKRRSDGKRILHEAAL